jgi:uncharacterized protein (TIGR04562 family)
MTMATDIKKKLLDEWTFSWPIMNVLIGGRSSIDLPEIQIAGLDEATTFLKSYGYDPDKTHDARLMHAAICEAISFIERWLMPKEWKGGNQPPDDVLLCSDARNLLLWACDRTAENQRRRIWSCAVLRVMHTIAHIEGAFRYSSIDVARDEIVARIQSVVAHDERGDAWVQFDDQRIRLYKLEWKTQKSRDSVLLKLLHKRANVAETIYDMLGVRFIAEHQSDVMQIVKLLQKSHVISFPNAIPSRSRNSIIDPDAFCALVEQLRSDYMMGKLSSEEFQIRMESMELPPPVVDKENLHSGTEYRAIQMTCRQLIRAPRPLTTLRKSLQSELEKMPLGNVFSRHIAELVSVLRNISRLSGDDEFSFFPFEIQVMDKSAWNINTTGKASHTKYKKSQLRAARRRVLNEILT